MYLSSFRAWCDVNIILKRTIVSIFDECLERGSVLDLVQHGNGKRIARSCSSVLSRSRLISFLLVLLVCVPPTILLLLLVVAHVRALLLLLLLLLLTWLPWLTWLNRLNWLIWLTWLTWLIWLTWLTWLTRLTRLTWLALLTWLRLRALRRPERAPKRPPRWAKTTPKSLQKGAYYSNFDLLTLFCSNMGFSFEFCSGEAFKPSWEAETHEMHNHSLNTYDYNIF